MKTISLYALIFVLISCSTESSDPTTTDSATDARTEEKSTSEVGERKDPMKFSPKNGDAILLGKRIQLLDADLKPIQMIFEGDIVQLLGVSEELIRPNNEHCDAFRYVKIKTRKITGYVDGRNVHELTRCDSDVNKVKGIDVEIYTTSYFGIPVMDDGGLTGCFQEDQPLVFKRKNGKYQFVMRDETEITEENLCPFFELVSNQGEVDKITSAVYDGKTIQMEIQREFQESRSETRKIHLYPREGSFYAIVL